jgi:hypothetical protein
MILMLRIFVENPNFVILFLLLQIIFCLAVQPFYPASKNKKIQNLEILSHVVNIFSLFIYLLIINE